MWRWEMKTSLMRRSLRGGRTEMSPRSNSSARCSNFRSTYTAGSPKGSLTRWGSRREAMRILVLLQHEVGQTWSTQGPTGKSGRHSARPKRRSMRELPSLARDGRGVRWPERTTATSARVRERIDVALYPDKPAIDVSEEDPLAARRPTRSAPDGRRYRRR